MRRTFDVRVQGEPETTRTIADALMRIVAERGARARFTTGRRMLPGTTVVVGIRDEDGPQWLAPIEVPDEPEEATRLAMQFLEEWGFVQAPPRAVQP